MPTFTVAAGTSKVHVKDSGGTERDVSDGVDTVSLPISSEAAETTTLNDTAQTRLGTIKDASVSLSGPRDATYEGHFFGLIGENSRVRFFPEGSSSGKVFYDGTAVWTSLESSGEVADALRFSLEGQGSGLFSRRTVA